MLTIPIPKFPKRASQSFNIQDVSQMMRKLTAELSQFMESQASSTMSGYLALNIAMTAWHMVDWLNKDMNAEQRKCAVQNLKSNKPISDEKLLGKAVTNACNALRICQVIATAGKHVKVEGKPDRTLATHFKIVRPNPDEAKRPGEGLSYIWIITRNPRKRKKEEYLAETVFKEAHRFWEDLLSHLGIIEDPIYARGRRGW
jgi:hypothetical protein